MIENSEEPCLSDRLQVTLLINIFAFILDVRITNIYFNYIISDSNGLTDH